MAWSCDTCGDSYCDGCGPEDTGDSRDFTPNPPAMLDPHWVLTMRRRIQRFRETGIVDWLPA